MKNSCSAMSASRTEKPTISTVMTNSIYDEVLSDPYLFYNYTRNIMEY